MVYPQANIAVPIYLHTPQGIILNNWNENNVLKLKKNLYGLKDAGRTWWEYLSSGLIEMGFTLTDTYQCVFMKDDTITPVYVDNCIIMSRTEH